MAPVGILTAIGTCLSRAELALKQTEKIRVRCGRSESIRAWSRPRSSLEGASVTWLGAHVVLCGAGAWRLSGWQRTREGRLWPSRALLHACFCSGAAGPRPEGQDRKTTDFVASRCSSAVLAGLEITRGLPWVLGCGPRVTLQHEGKQEMFTKYPR